MTEFLIGQHNRFDIEKLIRDYRKGFYGIEACLMKSQADVDELLKAAEERRLELGIHFPLRGWVHAHRDPLFLDLDHEVRGQAFVSAEEELSYIKAMGLKPQYILFHYPKPVIIRDDFDLSRWRFYLRSEYAFESQYPVDFFRRYSEFLFQWLSSKAEEHDFVPVLELEALNKYVMEETLLEDLLNKYPKVKLCIDLGRIHIQNKIDPHFSALELLRRYAGYAELLHLWNAKVTSATEYSHYPMLPKLSPDEGWAPVEDYFKVIRAEKQALKLLFEHRTDQVTDDELDSCYHWIQKLCL